MKLLNKMTNLPPVESLPMWGIQKCDNEAITARAAEIRVSTIYVLGIYAHPGHDRANLRLFLLGGELVAEAGQKTLLELVEPHAFSELINEYNLD